MTDKLDNLKTAKCLMEGWEQKYGLGGHYTRWVDLRPSDVEWAVAEIERLREELDNYKNGYKGACYACEPVGELNVKHAAEIERLRASLSKGKADG